MSATGSTPRLTPEREAEIEARLAAASARPWRACASKYNGDVGIRAPESTGVIAEFYEECLRAGERRPDLARANGSLAAHAPDDLHDLLAEVRARGAECERLASGLGMLYAAALAHGLDRKDLRMMQFANRVLGKYRERSNPEAAAVPATSTTEGNPR